MQSQGSEQLQVLKEILKWIRFTAAKEVKGVLTSALDTEQKKLIYHMSDGKNGAVEIARLAQTSDRTVRRNWEAWARLGLMEAVKLGGGDRYVKSFRLEDFGIDIPEVKAPQPIVTKQPTQSESVVSQPTLESAQERPGAKLVEDHQNG
jgi:hypothetical protein